MSPLRIAKAPILRSTRQAALLRRAGIKIPNRSGYWSTRRPGSVVGGVEIGVLNYFDTYTPPVYKRPLSFRPEHQSRRLKVRSGEISKREKCPLALKKQGHLRINKMLLCPEKALFKMDPRTRGCLRSVRFTHFGRQDRLRYWEGRVPESQSNPDYCPPARPGFVVGGVEISSELFRYLYAAGWYSVIVMSTESPCFFGLERRKLQMTKVNLSHKKALFKMDPRTRGCLCHRYPDGALRIAKAPMLPPKVL